MTSTGHAVYVGLISAAFCGCATSSPGASESADRTALRPPDSQTVVSAITSEYARDAKGRFQQVEMRNGERIVIGEGRFWMKDQKIRMDYNELPETSVSGLSRSLIFDSATTHEIDHIAKTLSATNNSSIPLPYVPLQINTPSSEVVSIERVEGNVEVTMESTSRLRFRIRLHEENLRVTGIFADGPTQHGLTFEYQPPERSKPSWFLANLSGLPGYSQLASPKPQTIIPTFAF